MFFDSCTRYTVNDTLFILFSVFAMKNFTYGKLFYKFLDQLRVQVSDGTAYFHCIMKIRS